MKKDLTSSVYTFEDLIQGNFLYVDKTEYIWQLIRPAIGMYFLSRPRRFGKSLLLSTLKAIFDGKKELFKGLAIYGKPYKWNQYPIIHIDFSNSDLDTAKDVREFLQDELSELSRTLKLPLRGHSLSKQFEYLIKDAALSSPMKKVVVLVDEYDKPILSNITNPAQCQRILKVLKGFYSNIKKGEKYTRLAFVTGVSKFCHVSLFSDLNNLTDITLNPQFAGMLGFTEDEIRHYFADRIADAAKASTVTSDDLITKLLDWYDGYRFSEADTHVCNPVSVSSFFQPPYQFKNYWDSTGTPTFLLELMRKQAYDYEAALNDWYDEGIFAAYELDRLDTTGMLWQTGYLTIKETRQRITGTQYLLDFPDREVKQTFMGRILEIYGGLRQGLPISMIQDFYDAISNDDPDGFMTILQSLFAGINYDLHIPNEKYYQTIFIIVFRLLGIFVEAEAQTNEGRIDAYVRTSKTVYIFEFKLNKNAKKAVNQIVDRHYYEKFQSCGLPIRMVGVNFNSEKGRIDGWKEMA
ncbi:MAG: ATP-binding protein [Victivallales bacterium]|nr:ATP-binding protein [Victivallales bacterium]